MQSCVLHLPGAEQSPPTAPSCSTRMGPPAPSGSSCSPSPAPGQPGTAHLLIKTSRSGSELNSCQQMQPACKARRLQSTQNMNAAITRAAVRQQCEVLFWCVLKQAENFSRAFSPFAEGQASRVLTSPTRSRGRRPGQKQAQGIRGTRVTWHSLAGATQRHSPSLPAHTGLCSLQRAPDPSSHSQDSRSPTSDRAAEPILGLQTTERQPSFPEAHVVVLQRGN